MERKELINSENELTVRGSTLLDTINSEKEEVIPVKTNKFNAVEMHKSLQNHLFSLKNKKQVVGYGGVYFIPSARDLEDFLKRFRAKYPELWNAEKIEKCLKAHITKCAKKESFAPAVKYYIIKEGSGSQLAAALEAFEDVTEKEKQFDIVDNKKLFE